MCGGTCTYNVCQVVVGGGDGGAVCGVCVCVCVHVCEHVLACSHVCAWRKTTTKKKGLNREKLT